MGFIQVFPNKSSGGGGTNDFEKLINRPRIDDTLLSKETTLDEVGAVNQNDSLTNEQLNNILSLIPD